MARIIFALLIVGTTMAPVLSDLSDFLPLNVGNRWTYTHLYYEKLGSRSASEAVHEVQTVTLGISRTREIDGKTYFVFNEMSGTRPAPAHTLFGKKVRWQGDSLMVHAGTSEYPLYRFTEASVPEQSVWETYSLDPSVDDDTSVNRHARLSGPTGFHTNVFWFLGSSFRDIHNPEYTRHVTFLRGFGMAISGEWVEYSGNDYESFTHSLYPEAARLRYPSSEQEEDTSHSSGPSDEEDAYLEIDYGRRYDAGTEGLMLHNHTTGTSSSSWGLIKERGAYR